MKISNIITGIGCLILILALPMPWLTVGGQFNFSLADVYAQILQGSPLASQLSRMLLEINNPYLPSIETIVATLILYPIAIVLAALSIWFKKLSYAAGVLSILAGLLWIFGIIYLKNLLIQEGAKTGEILAPLSIRSVVQFINVGYGAYVAVVCGVILILAFYSGKT
ncbi:MAG: hypothetical protein QXE05_04190 [Nitrososphaeria archaeon]